MHKVLLVDDDAALRATLRDMLEELDCEVAEAEDGEVASRMLQTEKPALVITDILMPNQEGIETIAEMRKAYPELPIVAMSGGGSTGNMTFLDYARQLGANASLQKPIGFDTLASTVDTLLPSRGHEPGGA